MDIRLDPGSSGAIGRSGDIEIPDTGPENNGVFTGATLSVARRRCNQEEAGGRRLAQSCADLDKLDLRASLKLGPG